MTVYSLLMVTLPSLAGLLGDILDTSPRNFIDWANALRADGLFSKGRQGPGSVPCTTADAVYLLIAGSLDHPRGVPIPELVRRVLELRCAEHVSTPPDAFPRLPETAGDGLRAIVDTMRAGRWYEEDASLHVTMDTRGLFVCASVHLPNNGRVRYGMIDWESPAFDKDAVRRTIALPQHVFTRIAEALGPL
jgi:hypothetical protein